jgi:argininosuccinate lyase
MKLWDKGYAIEKEIEKFTVGDDYLIDQNLVPYDCKTSIAHAEMLAKLGFLTKKEASQIKKTLDKIIELNKKGKFLISREDEDVHTKIENYLVKKLGDVGKKIHLARSRNDQVLVDIRMYTKDHLEEIKEIVCELKKELNALSKLKVKMPGYTHMRRAMPSSIKMWAESFIESLDDDLKLIDSAFDLNDQCPLGTGAGYGLPLKIDRNFLAKKLGFKKVQNNAIYTHNSRGKIELYTLNCLNQVMLVINKITSDLLLFSTKEFGYFELPNEFCTGSSIMPQKKNPDVLELLRAKTKLFSSYQFQMQSIIQHLPSGYNRDLQLTKKTLVEALTLAKDCIFITTLVIKKLKVNKENCEKAMTSELYATEEAYNLVKKGVPFRDAYRTVGEKYK